MNAISKYLAALALLWGPVAATADAVTYDYTGIVTALSSNYSLGTVTVGESVTGTYTIDIQNGTNPTGTPVGSTSAQWILNSSANGINYVFAMSISGNGLSFTTEPGQSFSQIANFSTSSVGPLYDFQGVWQGSADEVTESQLQLLNSSSATFTSSGLPLFAPGTTGQGLLFSPSGGELDYSVTSLTEVSAVPLPASAWLLLGGIGGLSAMARRRIG